MPRCSTIARRLRPLGPALLLVTFGLGALLAAELVLGIVRADAIRPYRSRLLDPNLRSENYLEFGENVPFRVRADFHGSFRNGESITTDSRGLRESGSAVGEDVDVLCLGDSFTFGYLIGDDQTYAAALQRALSCRGLDLTVANGGYSGSFSFDGAFVRYRRDLRNLEPRLVVFGVFPNNDYRDFAMNVWTKVDADGYPLQIRKARHLLTMGAYRFPLLRESRLFVGLYRLLTRHRVGDELEAQLEGRLDWRQVDLVVRGFAEETRANGARLVFVFLNEPGHAHARFRARNSARTVAEVEAQVAEKSERLKRILDRYGVPWLDDRDLIERSRKDLVARGRVDLTPCFAPERDALLGPRPLRFAATKVLAADDGIHYSWLMNVLLGQWLVDELSTRHLLGDEAVHDPSPSPSRAAGGDATIGKVAPRLHEPFPD